LFDIDEETKEELMGLPQIETYLVFKKILNYVIARNSKGQSAA
jgi:hypothetical protein